MTNYKQIVINGYAEGENYRIDYFKQEAQVAERDNFVGFKGFFNRCREVINDYKKYIEIEHYTPLINLNSYLAQYREALSRGEAMTPNGNPIQDVIKQIEGEIEAHDKNRANKIKEIVCMVTDAGDITDSRNDGRHTLYYSDMEKMEQAITQAERELQSEPKYEVPEKALENYVFWNGVNTNTHGHENIFEGVSEQQFKNMVGNADFTAISNKKNISQRVKFNIHVLARLMKKEWGEDAAGKIKTTLRDCGKKTNFDEYKAIESMYKQQPP